MVKSAASHRKQVSPEIAFGRVLRDIRKAQSLSQDDLGAESGYHRTYIGMLERGEKSPSLRTIFNLASTLKVDSSEIVKQVERIVGKR